MKCEEKPIDLCNHSPKKLFQSENKHTFRPWDTRSKSPLQSFDVHNSVALDLTPNRPPQIVIESQPEINNHATDYSANQINQSGQTVLVQHASLLGDLLLQLQLKPNDAILHQLIRTYTSAVSTLEQSRMQSLLMNSGHVMVHRHYNIHRLILIQHTKSQLMMLNYKSQRITTAKTRPIVQCLQSSTRFLNRIPTTPVQSPDNAPFDDSGYSPSLSSSCNSSPGGSPEVNRNTPTMGKKNVSDTPLSTPGSTNKPKRRHSNKPLDNKAVIILNTWYLANEKHPYLTIQSISQMGRKTGLAHAQIRKWLANRRLRSSNTYKKTGRMNPLRYHTIERRMSREQMHNKTEGVETITKLCSLVIPPISDNQSVIKFVNKLC